MNDLFRSGLREDQEWSQEHHQHDSLLGSHIVRQGAWHSKQIHKQDLSGSYTYELIQAIAIGSDWDADRADVDIVLKLMRPHGVDFVSLPWLNLNKVLCENS